MNKQMHIMGHGQARDSKVNMTYAKKNLCICRCANRHTVHCMVNEMATVRLTFAAAHFDVTNVAWLTNPTVRKQYAQTHKLTHTLIQMPV